MFECWRRAGLLALASACAGAAAQPADSLVIGGHLKSLAFASTTVDGAERGYALDRTRLRLEANGQLGDSVAVDAQLDNELLVGNYLRTRQAVLERQLPRRTYFDGSAQTVGRDAVGRVNVRRAAVTLARDATDLKIGRQRIAWGSGRFFSPLDVLNPFNPAALEPGERDGVDALLVEHKRSAVSRISFVAAPVRHGPANTLAQWHANSEGFDYSLVAGRFGGGPLLGADLAGQWRGAGLRAEWSLQRPAGVRSAWQRLLLGWDYAFANTLTLSAEVYYDGSGSGTEAAYDFASLAAGRRQTVARRYAAGLASYEITPLLKSINYLVLNLDDGSGYLSPRLTYSLRTNVDLGVGMQLFSGKASSEYGRMRSAYFAYVQWFF